MQTAKLDHRYLGNFCLDATKCRRFISEISKGSLIPMAAFDRRDKADGKCDGFLPRIMDPIRVETEGGEA